MIEKILLALNRRQGEKPLTGLAEAAANLEIKNFPFSPGVIWVYDKYPCCPLTP